MLSMAAWQVFQSLQYASITSIRPLYAQQAQRFVISSGLLLDVVL
jgi:hypothetical protein